MVYRPDERHEPRSDLAWDAARFLGPRGADAFAAKRFVATARSRRTADDARTRKRRPRAPTDSTRRASAGRHADLRRPSARVERVRGRREPTGRRAAVRGGHAAWTTRAPFTPHAPRRSPLDPVSGRLGGRGRRDRAAARRVRPSGARNGATTTTTRTAAAATSWSAPAASPDARERGFDRDDYSAEARDLVQGRAPHVHDASEGAGAARPLPPLLVPRRGRAAAGVAAQVGLLSKQAPARGRQVRRCETAQCPHPLFFRAAAFCRTSAIHDERTSASNCSSRSTVIDWRS